MATYYWRNTLGGNWSILTNWKDSSTGGVTPLVLPAATDNVIFDNLSGSGTVTLNVVGNAKSINFTGFGGTFTNSGTNALNVYGNLILPSGGTYNNVGSVNLLGTSASTLTTNGKSFGGNLFFGSSTVTCSYTCTDAVVVLGTTYIDRGTVNFAGGSTNIPNTPISIAQYAAYTPSLKTSLIYVGRYAVSKTIVANSIELTGSVTDASNIGVWEAGSYGNYVAPTYYLNITGLNKLFMTGNTTSAAELKMLNAGGNTFKDYYILTTGPGLCGTRINLASTFDNVYFASSSTSMRLRGCTINKSLDFTYSTGTWNQTGIADTNYNLKGDLILSTGMTLTNTPPLTFIAPSGIASYITLNGKTLNDAFNINGGNVIITDWFRSTSVITLTSGTFKTGSSAEASNNINCSNLNINGGTFTDYTGNTITLTGSLNHANSSNTTINSNINLVGISSTFTLTLNGLVTATGAITTTTSGASIIFNNNINVNTIALTQGSITIGKDVIATSISVSGAGSKTLNFNSPSSNANNITLTGSGTAWGFGTLTGATINNLNNTIIKLTNSVTTTTFDGGGLTYGTVWWNREGTTTTNIVKGNNTYRVFRDGTTYNENSIITTYNILAHTILFDAGSVHTFNAFQVNVANGNTITLDSTSSTTYNFIKTGTTTAAAVQCYNLIVNHCTANQPGSTATPPYYTWWAYSSLDNGGVTQTTGWNFVNKKYWVGKKIGQPITTNWNDPNNWSTTSGTDGGAGAPTSLDDVIFDSNSNTFGPVCNINATSICRSITFRGDTGSSDYTGEFKGTSSLSVIGGMVLSPTMNYNYTGTITFTDATNITNTPGSYSITSNGKDIISDLTFTGVYDLSKWTFTDFVKLPATSLTSNTMLTLNRGDIVFNGVGPTDPKTGAKYSASIGMFYSSGITTSRSITANNIEITGSDVLGGASYPWNATSAGITVNVTNIYVTSTFLGRRYIYGNLTNAALKNVWFYGPATASAIAFADYTGLGANTKVDNVYVRGNLASSTGTQTPILFITSIIGNLDFGTSVVYWNWSSGGSMTLTGNLTFSPNMTFGTVQPITFTNTINGSINSNGCTLNYPSTITINTDPNITISIPTDFSVSTLTITQGNVILGLPDPSPATTLKFGTFNVNGGNFTTRYNSIVRNINPTTSGSLNVSSVAITINGVVQIFDLTVNASGGLALNNTTTINSSPTINGTLNLNAVTTVVGAITIGNSTDSGNLSIHNKFTSSNNITLTKGNFGLYYNNPAETSYHARCNRFISNNANVRYITLASGSIFELAGTTSSPFTNPSWDLQNSTNAIINASSSTIKITGANSSTNVISFHGGYNVTGTVDVNNFVTGYSVDVLPGTKINYGKVWFKSSVTRTVYVFGGNVFEEFEDDVQPAGHYLYFQDGGSATAKVVNVFNNFIVNGTSSYITIINSHTGSASTTNYHYLVSKTSDIVCKYLDVRHSSATAGSGAVSWIARTSSDNGGSLPTIGWILTNNRYWVGRGVAVSGKYRWDNPSNWSDISGGTTPASVPTSTTSVIFDGNAVGKDVLITNVASCLDFDCTTFDGTFFMDGYPTSQYYFAVYGDFILGPSFVTFPSGNLVTTSPDSSYVALYSSSANNIITTNGYALKCNLQFNGNTSGSLKLNDNLATTGYIKYRSGVFNTSPDDGVTSYNILAARFLNYENYQSVIHLNNSTITLTGNNTYTYPTMTVSGLGTGVPSVWSLQGNGTGTSGTGSNITLYAGTSEIIMNNTSNSVVTFTGGGNNKVYNNITFSRDGSNGDNLISINAPVGQPKITFNEITDLGLTSHNLRFTISGGGVYMYNLSAPNTSPTNRITLDSSNGTNVSYLFSTNENIITVNYVTVNRIIAQQCQFATTLGYIAGPNTSGWNSCTTGNNLLPLTGVGQ